MQGLATTFPRRQLRLPRAKAHIALSRFDAHWASSLIWQKDQITFKSLRQDEGCLMLHYVRSCVARPYWRYTWPYHHIRDDWFCRRDRHKVHSESNRVPFSSIKADVGTMLLDVCNLQFVEFACGLIRSLCRDYSGLALDNGMFIDVERGRQKDVANPSWEYAGDKHHEWNQGMAEYIAALQKALYPKPVIVNVTAKPHVPSERKWLRMVVPNVAGVMFESPDTSEASLATYEWILDQGRILWWSLGKDNTIEDIQDYKDLHRPGRSYLTVPDHVLEVLE